MVITKRVNIDYPEPQMEVLRKLQKDSGTRDMKDFFNHAISFMEWAMEETAKGNEIAAVHENGACTKLAAPVLQYVKRARLAAAAAAYDHRPAPGPKPKQPQAQEAVGAGAGR